MSPKNLRQILTTHQLSLEDPFSCILGLSPLDVKVFVEILAGSRTVEQLVKRIEKNKSTIQRLLSNLLDLGLVRRYSSSVESGKKKHRGYFYIYEPLLPKQAQTLLLEHLENTYDKMKAYLETIWLEELENELKTAKKTANVGSSS